MFNLIATTLRLYTIFYPIYPCTVGHIIWYSLLYSTFPHTVSHIINTFLSYLSLYCGPYYIHFSTIFLFIVGHIIYIFYPCFSTGLSDQIVDLSNCLPPSRQKKFQLIFLLVHYKHSESQHNLKFCIYL